ncbi:MAG TPA: hypothetical protein VLB90_00835 [Pseudomonadales bacterium]|nr:hypothetical protein [Pseudomonadales bacterium]
MQPTASSKLSVITLVVVLIGTVLNVVVAVGNWQQRLVQQELASRLVTLEQRVAEKELPALQPQLVTESQ